MIPANPHPCPSPALLASRIAAERRRLGLTQRGAAALLGVPLKTYQRFEAGPNHPRLDSLFGLVMDAGMDPAALLPELFTDANSQVGNSHR